LGYICTCGLGLTVVGFRVLKIVGLGNIGRSASIGFFVGFGFGRDGVVLSQGDGLGFVMKFG